MIKENELRIGNKVAMRSITVNENITVTGVIENKIYYTPCKTPKFADFLWSLPIYIYPIELTEDWLIQFGFEYEKDNKYRIDCKKAGGYYIVYWSRISNEIHAFGISYGDEPTEVNNFTWGIKYVHQLQNLYFDLTGEELHTQAGRV